MYELGGSSSAQNIHAMQTHLREIIPQTACGCWFAVQAAVSIDTSTTKHKQITDVSYMTCHFPGTPFWPERKSACGRSLGHKQFICHWTYSLPQNKKHKRLRQDPGPLKANQRTNTIEATSIWSRWVSIRNVFTIRQTAKIFCIIFARQ